jgi:hypothetical protein
MTPLLGSHGTGDLRVQDEDESGTDGAECVGTSPLEEGGGPLLGHDLPEAVHGAAVHPLLLGLLRLHLQAAADRVEGVAGVAGRDGRELRAAELGGGAEHVALVLLVGVVARQGVEQAEVDPAVRDDAHDRDAHAVVEAADAGPLDGLCEAVHQAAELLLADADVGGEAGPGVIQGVDDHETTGSRQTARGHVDGEKLEKFGVLVRLREHGLDGVLEGEVEGLRGEVADDVRHVAAPEGLDALLPRDAGEAVHDAGVAGHLPADDLRVGVLRLDEELHSLDGGRAGLGDGAGHAPGHEVDQEIRGHGGIFLLRNKKKRRIKEV